MVIGGRSPDQNEELSLDVYNLTSNQWIKVLPVARFRHASWIRNGILYIHGGFEPGRATTPLGDLLRLDIEQHLS
jgi:Kelch motif